KSRSWRRAFTPQLFAPPFLGKEPRRPDRAKSFQAFLRLRFVIAVFKRSVSSNRGNLAFQPHYAMTVSFSSACGGRNPVSKCRIAHRPLERLLRTHGKTDDRP